ncbi:MAG TPA: protein-glutamate O-methyltransferase CheR [Rhizomicrobium sp.]
MEDSDFAFLAQLLRRRSGLTLPQDKTHLIERRLMPVARRFGLRDMPSLIGDLRHGRDALARAVTEAMTTNESSFFRDPSQFKRFRDVLLPRMLAARSGEKRLRIWSAACANGQEAYSIAMILDDMQLAVQGWSIDLIATDLSSAAIARAEEGRYSIFEVQRGVPPRSLVAHFIPEESHWRISERLRRMVTFRTFNLLDSYGWLDDIDIVFCRNVLFYLDRATKISLLERIAEIVTPDGMMLLSPAENINDLGNDFAKLPGAPGVYGKARAQRLGAVG